MTNDLAAARRIVELGEKATPGPWYTTGTPWFREGSGVLAGSPDPHVAPMVADCEQLPGEREDWRFDHPGIALGDPDEDAAFIVAARNDAPALATAYLQLLEKHDALVKALAELEDAVREIAEETFDGEACLKAIAILENRRLGDPLTTHGGDDGR